MTETIISLIPDYGLLVIFACVALGCLAVPVPASMMVLAAGAFAATGDLVLWQVMVAAFVAFVVGDQIAFAIASRAGPRILAMFAQHPKMARLVHKSRTLLDQRGGAAVLASHTIVSPTGPYVNYLCGAGGMAWLRFTVFAVPGAAIWVGAYVGLGYVFATQIAQVASMISQFFGLVMSVVVLGISLRWVRHAWRRHQADMAAQDG